MSRVFPKNFPDVFLRVQFWAVTWQIIQLYLVRCLGKVFNRFTFMIRCTIDDEYQIAVGRSPESDQESPKRLLPEIVHLHPIAKATQARDCTDGFDTFVTPEGVALWCLSNTRPSTLYSTWRRPRHFIFKKDGGGFQAWALRNLGLDFGFPAILRGGIGQCQQALWFLDAKAARSNLATWWG